MIMRQFQRAGRNAIAVLALSAMTSVQLGGQQAGAADKGLITAIVKEGTHLARNVLSKGGQLIVEAEALRAAMPSAAPVEGKVFGPGTVILSHSEAMTCVTGPNCLVRGNGALLTIDRVESGAQSATADIKILWNVQSARRGTVNVWSSYRLTLSRDSRGWSVISTTRLRAS